MKAIITKAKGHDSVIMISTNNEENASVMLRSELLTSNDQGFLQKEVRVGLLKGKTADLKAMNLIEGQDISAIMPVKLIVKEAFEPFYPGQEPKKNPTNGEIVTSGGAPVYRQTLVVSESSAETDTKLLTDKIEATITAAQPAKEFGQ
jgi:hypothetical protein